MQLFGSIPTMPNIVIPSGRTTVDDKPAITVVLIIVIIIVVPIMFSLTCVCCFYTPLTCCLDNSLFFFVLHFRRWLFRGHILNLK